MRKKESTLNAPASERRFGRLSLFSVVLDKKEFLLLVKSPVDKFRKIAYHIANSRQKGFFDGRSFLLSGR